MSMTDPIADLLTRLRNSNGVRHETVQIPSSKLKLEIVRILKDEGFISNYKCIKDKKQGVITVYLKYGAEKKPVITALTRVSTPGRRVYYKKGEFPKVLGGLGISILTTSRGVMTDQQARKVGVGGEVLCTVF
ncbi:MAG: 30S ribosomal protein S8 [Acidobacteria bacterium]|nr:30S ribosomal protein S8 [Acidobacteriota bacterium]MBI3657631.1 30S ribosomal protein S8 [Acidobacteriota bacterium]